MSESALMEIERKPVEFCDVDVERSFVCHTDFRFGRCFEFTLPFDCDLTYVAYGGEEFNLIGIVALARSAEGIATLLFPVRSGNGEWYPNLVDGTIPRFKKGEKCYLRCDQFGKFCLSASFAPND